MKKLICLLLIICLFPVIAAADSLDLSDLSYDQLVALQHYITMEIMKRPEWKEVNVPAGKWIVGVDIPEGEYSIKPYNGGAYITIIDTKGEYVTYGGIRNEDNAIGKIWLKEAYTVEIDGGTLTFAPAIVLGF